MRRLLLLALLVCLAVPAAAAAIRRAPGDGALSVRGATGYLRLELARGAVIGRVDGGILDVNPLDGDCAALEVWGADLSRELVRERLDGTEFTICRFVERFRGGTSAAIRFRLDRPNTMLTIRQGVQFAVSAVGRGRGFIQGAGGVDDGFYAVNGDAPASLPDDGRRFVLGTLLP